MKILTNPKEIEAKSFQIVDKYLACKKMPGHQREIIRRVVHATSDLNYIDDMAFHPKVVNRALEAIRKGRSVVVDAAMVQAGINKSALSDFGGGVVCLINKKSIGRLAPRLNVTRAALAMRRARKKMNGAIVAIGNAPTALFEICDLVAKGEAMPAVIIGLPVGFVGAKEAKARLRALNIPYITNRTRRGGSAAAAACVNALLKISCTSQKGSCP